MAQKKSALTSALTTAISAKDSPAKIPPAVQNDDFSFPCLTERPPTIDELSEAVEQFDISKKASLYGSARVGSLLADGRVAADYDIDPHRRRAGKERFPSSLDSKEIARSANSNFLSEAVIGSLPKGMSYEERTQILRNTPLSPTLNLLNSMPLDKVTSRSLDGKKLRRHVLRGAVMVYITAGYSGKRFVFEKAKELGVRSVVIDGPDSWVQNLVKEGIVEKFLPIDFSDTETVFERCEEAIAKAKEELGELDGILSFCEMAQPLVARLTEKFGLPGNTAEAVDSARDKFATRQSLAKAGLPTPKNFLITDASQLDDAAAKVGFPAVIKPIFGAASLGVQRVDNLEGLKSGYANVIKELKNAKVVAGAIQEGDSDEEADGSAAGWINLSVVMEEYLDGPEVDVDIIFSDGQPVYGAVSDNWPTVEPYFNETGSNSPSILAKEQQKELLDLAVASTKALGFTMGVFHVELKYTKCGARLIEVNCRMGGGPVRNINLLVWGVDLVEEQLLLSAGIPSRPPTASKPLKCIAELSVNAPKSGIIENTDYLNAWQDNPDVLYARPIAPAGGKVTGPQDGMPSWVCELMVARPTVEEAIDLVKSIEASIVFPIKDKVRK